jgi:acylphosphatase
MKRLTLIVSGKVQKAGYRDIMIRLGAALGLKGYAENLPDGRVKVVAEGEEKKLVSEGETDERLDRAAELMKELIEVNRSGFSSLKADTSAMLEKQDKMLEKQDMQTEITKNGFNDMRKGFADLKEEIAKSYADVKEEIHMLRDDFRELFMHEVSELRSEIAEVKAALARMQAG